MAKSVSKAEKKQNQDFVELLHSWDLQIYFSPGSLKNNCVRKHIFFYNKDLPQDNTARETK